MEELLSTDSIHKEILDDARRKAAKILKTVEDSQAAASREWTEKLEKAVSEVKARYDAEVAEQRAEAGVRLTMDKARARLMKETGELSKAARLFFETTPRAGLLDLLSTIIARRVAYAESMVGGADMARIEVCCAGMTKAEAEAALQKAGIGERVLAITMEEKAPSDALPSGPASLPAFVLSTGAARITASIEAEAEDVLRAKRAETVEAIFGRH
jgi:hypothetical protein